MKQRSYKDRATDGSLGEPSMVAVVVDGLAGGRLYWDRLFILVGCTGFHQ